LASLAPLSEAQITATALAAAACDTMAAPDSKACSAIA
jgi:hypothetical protein